MRKAIIAILIVMLAIIAGCTSSKAPTGETTNLGEKITVYKSQSCGCCDGYITHLKREGMNVEVVSQPDVTNTKDQYGVPADMRSCHTSVVGKYFVEGHVPIEAINKLISEKPDIKGIALPGMPSAAPGMPGKKEGKFKVMAVKNDGSTELFLEI